MGNEKGGLKENTIDDGDDVKNLANELLGMFSVKEKDTNWIKEVQIKTHTLKGLCGIYGLTSGFNHLKIMEKFMKLCSLNKGIIEKELSYFKNVLTTVIKERKNESYSEFKTKDIRCYKIVYNFSSISAFSNVIHILNELTYLTNIRVNSRKISIDVLSQISISEMRQMFCALGIEDIQYIKCRKVNIEKPSILNTLFESINCTCYKMIFLQMLEMCNRLSKIVHKQFKLNFYSNIKHFSLEFWRDMKIPFMELLKNAFAHSEKGKKLKINVAIIKIKNEIRIYVYNTNSKVRNGSAIFDYQYTTSKLGELSGNGLGLFETKRLVDELNGKIKYRNHINGVYFLIRVPKKNYVFNRKVIKV